MEDLMYRISYELRLILELLLVMFIVLKLSGLIDWSWVWVLCPFWIPCLIVLVLAIVFWIASKINKTKVKRPYE